MAVKKLSERKIQKLHKALDAFIERQTDDFSLSGLFKSPGIQADKDFTALTAESAVQELQSTRLVFTKDGKLFKPRQAFFHGSRFIISLTEEEILSRILIPGHRFLPFHSGGVDPWNCVLLLEGEKLPVKSIRKPINSLPIYYTLLGWENAPSLFMADHEENRDIFDTMEHTGEKKALITVFDLDRALQDPRYAPGTRLLCEVLDWRRGVFSLSFLPKDDGLGPRKPVWARKMEKGFRETFDLYGLNLPIFEQIAYGYFHAGAEVLKNPPLHFGGLLHASDRLYLVSLGMESRLWHEQTLTMSVIAPWEKREARYNPESFPEVLEASGILRKEAELEAYIREELFQRRGACEDPGELGRRVLERIKQGEEFAFAGEILEHAFNRHFKRLVNRVIRRYNYFADQDVQKIRSQILLTLDDYYAWLHGLDAFDAVDPSQIQLQTFAETAQTISFLAGFLEPLNEGGGSEEETKTLTSYLPQMQQNLEDMRIEISGELEQLAAKVKKAPPPFTLVRPGSPAPKPEGPSRKGREILQFRKPAPPPPAPGVKAYTMKISLRDIRPMIWRTFLVPGGLRLNQFHGILQAVMGWDYKHAYEFCVNNQRYNELNLPEETEEVLDARGCALDSLGLREKQRFIYTYDFGDNWEHEILVSKIDLLDPDGGGGPEPVCLKGQRACPPEDCGGVWGYRQLLEDLAAPRDKRREGLAVPQDYDPEAFSVAAVNRAIAKAAAFERDRGAEDEDENED
ncbi:MAG: plasmid pRiA4b ORF-3 family protein [Treponema sp.]|jgi:hypothetical protein|nr:plasmid pRiA4b ORF-3 family protein [Treponema sp.]